MNAVCSCAFRKSSVSCNSHITTTATKACLLYHKTTLNATATMHWRAIKQSSGRNRSNSLPFGDQAHDPERPYQDHEEALQTRHVGAPIPQGQDEACDDQPAVALSKDLIGTESVQSTISSNFSTQGESSFRVPIPITSNGLVTFAYQRALRNRIKDIKLASDGEYDMHRYTPTFIQDCLMLPGTLASALEKVYINTRSDKARSKNLADHKC